MSGAEPVKGFAALAEYDYFKARKIFYQRLRSDNNAAAAYGLALISMRGDNPFHHLDSACKYVNRSFNYFKALPLSVNLAGFTIDSQSIRKLADTISYKCWLRAREIKTVKACDHFLVQNYLGRKKLIYDIIYLRDELEYSRASAQGNSDSTRFFIVTHPQSLFMRESLALLDRQLFEEGTRSGSKQDYIKFINQYPRSAMLNAAYEKLFNIYRTEKDIKGLSEFAHKYLLAPQNLDAWKLLFSLTVKSYSNEDLRKFIDDYPRFPLKSTILRELELNRLELIPLEKNDFMGYFDSSGKEVIKPQFDEASVFSEGLAVVSKNDSVFYINKENVNTFNKFYNFATPFRNGIAAVRQGNRAFFINRQGQVISPYYDEIAEPSGGAYVIRLGNKYGAVDQFAQVLIEPQFEKLGDFKSGYAYYVSGGLFGFVSREGKVHPAQYEWIGNFNERQLAVIKMQGKFGLVNFQAQVVLEPAYDQLIPLNGNLFLVISGNNYGFYSGTGCFAAIPVYDYNKEIAAESYSDGVLIRLLRKDQQALADLNGKMWFAFGVFENFGFPAEGLIRVQQKKKWGYVDDRTNTVIVPRYQSASDFQDGVAVVTQKDQHLIIDVSGKELYKSTEQISRYGKDRFLVRNGESSLLVDRRGIIEEQDIETVQQRQNGGLLLEFINGDIKLLHP